MLAGALLALLCIMLQGLSSKSLPTEAGAGALDNNCTNATAGELMEQSAPSAALAGRAVDYVLKGSVWQAGGHAMGGHPSAARQCVTGPSSLVPCVWITTTDAVVATPSPQHLS